MKRSLSKHQAGGAVALACFLVSTTVTFPSCEAFASVSRHQRRLLFDLHSVKDKTDEEIENRTQEGFRPGSMMAATKAQGRVPYGESSRQYRRTVYSNYENWVDHRASFGILDNLNGILFSGVIRQLKDDVLVVVLAAIFVVLWNGFVGNQGTLLPHLALPWQPFTLSSPALGLLLVFRTNTSYSRWLEARTKWSTIQTHSINLARMAATFVDASDPAGEAALDRLVQNIWALPRSLMNKLSGFNDNDEFEKEILSTFGTDKDSAFLTEKDRTMVALMELSYALNDLPIDEKRCLEMDKSIILLGECISSCERIFISPVPLVYTRHTARFLSLWMLLLPFPLYDLFVERNSILTPQVFMESLVLVPAVAVLAVFLFGIQELSVQLEEPFSILPMQKFCDDIKTTTSEMKNRAVQHCLAKSLD